MRKAGPWLLLSVSFLFWSQAANAESLPTNCPDAAAVTADASSLIRSLENTVWTFESPVWTGEVTFFQNGVYQTVWGKGKWALSR